MKALMMAGMAALVTANAWAGDGKEAAAKICAGLYKDADKKACVVAVDRAKSFDEGAVKVCKGLYKDEDKVACVKGCADKIYGAATMKICDGLYKDEDKLACIVEGGRKTGGDALAKDEREETILDIDRVLRNLERDEVTTAIRRLKNLRDRLEKKD